MAGPDEWIQEVRQCRYLSEPDLKRALHYYIGLKRGYSQLNFPDVYLIYVEQKLTW